MEYYSIYAFDIPSKLNEECGERFPYPNEQDWEWCAGDYIYTNDYIEFYKFYATVIDDWQKHLLINMIVQGIEDFMELSIRRQIRMVNIAIVDDNKAFLQEMKQNIEACKEFTADMVCDTYCSGADFLQADRGAYQLAILDMQMAGMGGYEIAQKLREWEFRIWNSY